MWTLWLMLIGANRYWEGTSGVGTLDPVTITCSGLAEKIRR